MVDTKKIHFLRFILVAICSFAYISRSMSQELSIAIEENNIISLSGSPAIKGSSSSLDESGRYSLMLDLEFANDCVRENGIDAKYARLDGRITHVLIMRRLRNRDCPDIYQPVISKVRVLLPSSLDRGSGVYLVGKPLSNLSLARITFSQKVQPLLQSDMIIEAVGFAGENSLPLFELDNISVIGGQRGYVISGRISVNTNCSIGQIDALLLEVPDVDGEPQSDVLIITASSNCLQNTEARELKIQIKTPQNPSGRAIFILNRRRSNAIPLDSR